MQKTMQSKMALLGDIAEDLEKFAQEFRQPDGDGIHIRRDRCLANADLLDKYAKKLRVIIPPSKRAP